MTLIDSLVLHPTTKLLLAPFIQRLPHALLLHGHEGVGLASIARNLGGRNVTVVMEPKNSKGDSDHNGTITVEAVRQLYDQTRAKHTGDWVIVIDDADRMSHGAQSAFLKLLEEPNEGTHFILTSHQPEKLLPTIMSRVQALKIQPLTGDQTLHFLADLGVTDQKYRIQLRYIADGLPAELHRLVNDPQSFDSRAVIIGDARDFLQAESYKKAIIVQKYKTDRAAAMQLIDGAITILRKTLSVKPEDRIVKQLKLLLTIKERLQSNANVALQLMRFVL